MISILLIWCYIFFTSYMWGIGGLRLLNSIFKLPLSSHNSPVILSFIGLVFITVFAGMFSIFFPIAANIHIAILAFSFIISLWQKPLISISFPIKLEKQHLFIFLFLVSSIIYFLIKTSGPLTNPDSAGYHLPLIKWIENYKAIKGIANIHSRFGFNYQYLVLAAVYGLSFINGSTFHALNGYFMLMLVLFFINNIYFIKTKKWQYLDTIALICLFFVFNMSNAIASFSPDFPSAAMCFVCLFIFIQKIELPIASLYTTDILIIYVLSLGAFLFKISCFPLIIINIYLLFYFLNKKEFGKITFLFILTIAFVFPFLYRNYILSGYLVYPFYSIDIFNVLWKVPMAKAILEKDVIFYCCFGFVNKVHFGFVEGFRLWWHYLKSVNSIYIYIIITLFSSFLFCIKNLFTIWQKEKTIKNRYFFLQILLILNIVFWAANAPDPRFGSGFIYTFIALNIAILFQNIFQKHGVVILHFTFSCLCVISLFMTKGNSIAKVKGAFHKTEYNLIEQSKYPKSEYSRTFMYNSIINYKTCTFCWETPQPCSFDNDNEYIFMGKSVEDGFAPKK